MDEHKEVSEALINQINAELTPTQIATMVEFIVLAQQEGAVIQQVFTNGTLVPDLFVMEAAVTKPKLTRFIDIFQQRPGLRHIEIFPQGMPQQDVWRTRIGLSIKNK